MHILVTFFACLVFCAFQGAEASVGAQFPELDLKASPTPAPDFTWTLEQVLDIAQKQNPDVKEAKFNFEAASKTIVQARSGYLPSADISGSYEQTNLPYPSAGLNNQLGTVLPYSSVVARIHQTIFDFGKTLSTIEARSADTESAGQTTMVLKNTISLHAEMAFFNVRAAEKLVEVAREGVAKFDETLRRTAVLVRTGTRPQFDLSQANVELSKAKLSLTNAENISDLAKVTLLNIMGLPQDSTFTLVEPSPSEIVEMQRLKLPSLDDLALANRPEIKQSESAIKSSQALLHREYLDFLPTISLEGWYGQFYPSYPTSINDAWGGGVTLTWNVFDGLKTMGRTDELAARLGAQGSRFERQRQNILAEVAQSYMNLKKDEISLQVAHESLAYAVENARLAKKRYEADVATFLELLVAETSLLDAQAGDVQARYQYEIGLASLENAVNLPMKEILK